MNEVLAARELNLTERLRRSKGRSSRSRMANARVTEDELKELETAAEAESKALSEWAREVLLREARRAKSDALFTEVVATRMLLNYVLEPLACGQVVTREHFVSVLTRVRAEKHKQAEELMRQYAGEAKE